MRSFLTIDKKKISALSLGLMTNLDPSDEKEKLKLYTCAYESGINSFDSAPNYLNGYSDIFLGKLIKQVGRENLFITNKVFFSNPHSPFSNSLCFEHINLTVNGVLKAMNTDYIDCLILHRFDFENSIDETLKALDFLFKNGKIKSWGVSAFSVQQILDFYYLSKNMGLPSPLIGQYAYNLFNREIEKELSDVCSNKKINIFGYYPLAQGVLTGKYSNKTSKSRANNKALKKFMWDLTHEKILKTKILKEFCSKKKLDIVSISLLWCLRNNNISSLITNIRNQKQLKNNINSIDSSFNCEIINTLEKIFDNNPINQYTFKPHEIRTRTL